MNKIMNNSQLKEFFENLKIGDEFTDIQIKNVSINNTSRVLQEIAREYNVEFFISFEFFNNETTTYYRVISPSKKFLNKQGQWSMPTSKKVEDFVSEYFKEVGLNDKN